MDEREMMRLMVNGSLRLLKPWKVALIVSNLVWLVLALVLSLMLYTGRPVMVECAEYRPGPAVEELQE